MSIQDNKAVIAKLQKEHDDLSGNIERLSTFLKSKPAHVSSYHIDLLALQLSAMQKYLKFLDLRIGDLQDDY